MEHVVAPDLVRAVGEAVRVRVGGRGEQQLGAVRGPARDDDDVALQRLLASVDADHDARDRGARGVGLEPDGLGAREEGHVWVLERGAHGDDLGVGFGVHEAREAVAVLTPHALAVGQVALVEQDPARRVERVEALLGEVVGQLLDPGLVRDRGERVGSARRRLGRILAARAVDLVELLRRCSTAPCPRRRSATPARSRRGAGARRSPPPAGDTARRRTAWSRRRRSSAPAAGTASRSA